MPKYRPGDLTRTINFRIPVEIFDRLEHAAGAERRSFNNMATQLIDEALHAREARYRRAKAKGAVV